MTAYCKSGAVLMLALALSASAHAAESDAQKIERLERAVDELKQQIEELKRGLAKPEPAPPQAAAAPTPARPAPAESPGIASQVLERVQIGGYGSTRFEAGSAEGQNPTFTLRRFVLTADAAIAPRLRSVVEIEFERFRELELERTVVSENNGLTIKESIEGTNQSEIALEQAWLEYELAQALKTRIGAVLVPLGRFNLNHDDNRWDLPRRSLVDRGAPVLPVEAAWDELGAGANGEMPLGERGSLGYQLYVMNGAVLEPEVESEFQSINAEGISEKAVEVEFSPSNGTFGDNDVKGAKAVAGRLLYSPTLGHEIAGSFYHGRYTPDFLPSADATAFGFDGLSVWGPFELEAEYVHTSFGNLDEVATAFAARAVADETAISNAQLESTLEFAVNSLAETRQGYWLEARYRFRPAWLKESIFGRGFEDPVLSLVVRGEQVWFDGLLQKLAFSGGQVTELDKVDRRLGRLTIGGSFRPVPLVVFQLAYELTHVDKGSLAEVTNFLDSSDKTSNAVLIGAAFGF